VPSSKINGTAALLENSIGAELEDLRISYTFAEFHRCHVRNTLKFPYILNILYIYELQSLSGSFAGIIWLRAASILSFTFTACVGQASSDDLDWSSSQVPHADHNQMRREGLRSLGGRRSS